MSRFRKLPVEVDALLFTSDNWDEVRAFVGDALVRYTADGGFRLRTLESVLTAVPGDWIIKGVQGELYPCKPDIFEQTYEPVE